MPAKRKYGWKRQPFDPRDRVFLARFPRRRLPLSADLSDLLGPVLDQGDTNTCGPHAAATLIEAGQTANKQPVVPPSRLFIYWVAREQMGETSEDGGVINRDLLAGLADEGWCSEADWAFDPANVLVQPPQACFSSALAQRLTDYAYVSQTLSHMMSPLASGKPFLAGFNAYESLESDEVARTGSIPMPSAGEVLLGGHDVAVYGYDATRSVFLIRNSWGEGWGSKGNGEIPFDYLVNPQLAGDFWVIDGYPGGPEPISIRPPVLRAPLT